MKLPITKFSPSRRPNNPGESDVRFYLSSRSGQAFYRPPHCCRIPSRQLLGMFAIIVRIHQTFAFPTTRKHTTGI